MTQRTTSRPPTAGRDEPAGRSRSALEHAVDSRHELETAAEAIRQVDLCLGQKRLLHRQPWRQPLHPNGRPVSTLERIRRFAARARLH